MPKKTETPKTPLSEDNPYSDLIENEDQIWYLYRIEKNGKRVAPEFLEEMLGFDEAVVKERWGGGVFRVRPVNEQKRFIKGGFQFKLHGAPKDTAVDDDLDDSDLEADSASLPASDRDTLEWFMDKLDERDHRILDLLTNDRKGGSGMLNADDIGKIMDTMLQKNMVYSSMMPLIETMRGSRTDGKNETLGMMRLMMDMFKEVLSVNQAAPAPQSDGVLGIVERFLPQLMQIIQAKNQAGSADYSELQNRYKNMQDTMRLLEQDKGKEVQPRAPLSDERTPEAANAPENEAVVLAKKIHNAINALIGCLEGNLSDEVIVKEFLLEILSPADVEQIKPHLTFENILGQVNDYGKQSGDMSGKMILMENQKRVENILGLLKGEKKQ